MKLIDVSKEASVMVEHVTAMYREDDKVYLEMVTGTVYLVDEQFKNAVLFELRRNSDNRLGGR